MCRVDQLLIYYGDGEERFGDVIRCAEAALRQDGATDLCNMMRSHGSDKGLGWHNYTVLYKHLFEPIRSEVSFLMEVGLGTNNTDVPSNMGEHGVPGASLRGWREYFPGCTILGADVDRRILFEEDRIRTFFVDQTDRGTIRSLLSVIPHIKFDIFIDDGLHEIEANRNLFEEAIHRVRPGGLYVIEDIMLDAKNINAFDDLLQNSGRSGFLYKLPGGNQFDNAVAVVRQPSENT